MHIFLKKKLSIKYKFFKDQINSTIFFIYLLKLSEKKEVFVPEITEFTIKEWWIKFKNDEKIKFFF